MTQDHDRRAQLAHGALEHHVEELAANIGRLRRHPACEPDSSLSHLADRLASSVDTIDAVIQPTAADLFLIHLSDGNDTTAVNRALADVDTRRRRLASLLGATT